MERATERGAAYDFCKVGTAIRTCETALIAEPFVLTLVAKDHVPLAIHDGRTDVGMRDGCAESCCLSTAKAKIDFGTIRCSAYANVVRCSLY
jgi:hypothetical protein